MNTFVQKFANIVKGVITGFDRIVFKGSILPLMYEKGVMSFCQSRGILNKEYKNWMLNQTAKVVDAAEQYAKEECDSRITPIKSSHIRKEEMARQHQRENQIQSGLIGIWSAIESCRSYKARYSTEAGFPQLRGEWTKCKHLYFYYDHEEYGFMNIRLQTWLPYHIQIALNGREWLRRGLEREHCDFLAKGNKFLHIADYEKAQHLLDRQLETRWEPMLNGFLPAVFPAMKDILGPHLSYYWTLWQSEWATDLIFPSARDLNALTESLMRHAFMTGTSARVLRYLDRPMTKAGIPYASISNEVSRPKRKEGRRIRALDPIGKDRALLQAISDPEFCISGITNKALREKLQGEHGYDGRTEKQLSAKISRQLRLLRDHGPIRKTPRRFKYQLSANGRELTSALNALLTASTQQLMDIAA